MGRFRLSNDIIVRWLAFIGAGAAVLAQADDMMAPKTWAGALAAGCAAVLALLRSPGQAPPIGGGR